MFVALGLIDDIKQELKQWVLKINKRDKKCPRRSKTG